MTIPEVMVDQQGVNGGGEGPGGKAGRQDAVGGGVQRVKGEVSQGMPDTGEGNRDILKVIDEEILYPAQVCQL